MRVHRRSFYRKRGVGNHTSRNERRGRCRTSSDRRRGRRRTSASGHRHGHRRTSAGGFRERRLRNSASAPPRGRHSRSLGACGQPHMTPSARGRNAPFGKSAHRALRIERNRVSASGRFARDAPCQTKGFSPGVSTNGPLVHRGLIRVCVMQEALRRIPHKRSAGTWENGRRSVMVCSILDPLNSPDAITRKIGGEDWYSRGQAA